MIKRNSPPDGENQQSYKWERIAIDGAVERNKASGALNKRPKFTLESTPDQPPEGRPSIAQRFSAGKPSQPPTPTYYSRDALASP